MDDDQWCDGELPSNRAEVLSAAVRANMRRRRDLPIAFALQPVAAVAWAVVDGLATDEDLLAAALHARAELALRVGAYPERELLGLVIRDVRQPESSHSLDDPPFRRTAANAP